MEKKYLGTYKQVSPTFVPFYGDFGEDLFANFWVFPISIEINKKIETFQTSEAAYHAFKYLEHPEIITELSKTKTGEESFQLTRKYEKELFKDSQVKEEWNSKKVSVMKDVLKIKFAFQEYKNVLLETQDGYLVEHCPVKGRDNFWSDDNDGTGLNMLGNLLMELRGELGGFGKVDPPKEYVDWIKIVKV
jgi:GTP cyclohydrolase II